MTRKITLEVPLPHDIDTASWVEVLHNPENGKFWINVDGQCVLRVRNALAVSFNGENSR